MLTIFEEDRVTHPLYRYTRISPARKLRTKAEFPPATSCCPDRISQETHRHTSPHWLSGFLRGVRATLREWRRRKNGRLELARLDERMLRDIGLTRSDVDCESNKPFWRK